jgi:iron complex transport system ATP-binding protein
MGYSIRTAMTYQIQHLGFGYTDEPVIRNVSLRIERGEFVAIVGPNGVGKSTLLKLMAGLLSRFDGSIRFLDRPLADYRAVELAQRLAFVPQETHVVFPFTSEEMIRMGRLPYRSGFLFDSASDDEYVQRALALTDTGNLADKVFTQISGGERQRVVLASALTQTPEVLLLDEPTVYLDMKHQLQFYEILSRLNRQEHMTIVAVTHDINLAARHAGRMVALSEGTIVADGRPEQVLTAEKLYEVFGITADILDRPDGRKVVIPNA